MKTGLFLEPMAMTEFQLDEWMHSAVNDVVTDWNTYSSDFVLYEMGSFDTVTGNVTLTDKKALRSLSEYKKKVS
ncbi:nonstructural protein [Microviridae sp.]|nr:nonstructural protein [Microviridae sp.]